MVFVLLAELCGVAACVSAQVQTRVPSGSDDVVFAIAFSPDERILAIARGAGDPAQRFGRIELWDTSTGKLRHVIKGFDGPVGSISFSSDGDTIVSASSEMQIEKIQPSAGSLGAGFVELRWWDAKSGELKQRLRLPAASSPLGNYEFARAIHSPDGKRLAVTEYQERSFVTGDIPSTFLPRSILPAAPGDHIRFQAVFNSSLKLLDAKTGELQLKVNIKRNQPVRAIFSPDGELVATWTQRVPANTWNKDQVILWNARTGKEEHKVKDLNGEPRSVVFSPDGKLFAMASTKYRERDLGEGIAIIATSEIRVFDVHAWKLVARLTNLDPINSLAFAPDGRAFIIGGLVTRKAEAVPGIKLFDLQTRSLSSLFTGGEDFTEAVDALVLSKSADLLAFQSGPTSVKVFDTQSWRMKQRWDADSAGDAVERPTSRFLLSLKRVIAVAFSPDSRTISGETDDGEIKWWDARTGELKQQIAGDNESPSLVATAANAIMHAEVTNGVLRLWNTTSQTKRTVAVPGGESISAIALSSAGEVLAVETGNDLKLLDVKSGKLLKILPHQHGQVSRIEFSRDDRTLATSGGDGKISIWDLSRERLEKIIDSGGPVSVLRFSPDGHTLAIASLANFSVGLWNLQTGSLQQKLNSHTAVVNALAFSSDGQMLASGGDDRMVVIWETRSGKHKRKLKGHDQTVASLAFSPDGTVLASAGGNAAVVLWEVEKGRLARILR